jgi:F-type H+-transporting ATPase subunit gamma
MSGQLRTLKQRIRSVENTQKITRAMEMISAAKLHRFQDMMAKGAAYAEGLHHLLKRLSRKEKQASHPFLEKRAEKKIAVLLLTSDTGLCGSYNLELIHRMRAFLKAHPAEKTLLGIGKFGIRAFKGLGYPFCGTWTDTRIGAVENVIGELTRFLEELYAGGGVDAIYVIGSRCLTKSSYTFVAEKLLPFENFAGSDDPSPAERGGSDYLFEPDEAAVFSRLIPLLFEAKVRQIFLESFVAEQIARMRAMHLATQNASDMISGLVIQRNKIRQAAITKEIIEVVSGSKALK